MEVPRVLDSAVVVQYAPVTGDVRPTGNTPISAALFRSAGNWSGADSLPQPLSRSPTTPTMRVTTSSASMNTETSSQDTWHETVDDALEQAEFDYEGLVWTTPPT